MKFSIHCSFIGLIASNVFIAEALVHITTTVRTHRARLARLIHTLIVQYTQRIIAHQVRGEQFVGLEMHQRATKSIRSVLDHLHKLIVGHLRLEIRIDNVRRTHRVLVKPNVHDFLQGEGVVQIPIGLLEISVILAHYRVFQCVVALIAKHDALANVVTGQVG